MKKPIAIIGGATGLALLTIAIAARGESPAAFGRRCIPAPTPTRWETRVGGPGADCVAPPSHIPDMLGRRALSAGRLAALGATPDFHHGLLRSMGTSRARGLRTMAGMIRAAARRSRI